MKMAINIDFEVMRHGLQEYAREKAKQYGSSIVYTKDGKLIEENPNERQIIIIKTYAPSKR